MAPEIGPTLKKLVVTAVRSAIWPELYVGGGTCLWHTHVGTVVLQRLLDGHPTKVQWGIGGVSVPLLRLFPPALGSREIGGVREKASLLNGAFHSWIMLMDGARIQIVDLALDMFRDRQDLSPTEWPIVPRYVWADVQYGINNGMPICRVPWRRLGYVVYPEMKEQVHTWMDINREPLIMMIEDAWERLKSDAQQMDSTISSFVR